MPLRYAPTRAALRPRPRIQAGGSGIIFSTSCTRAALHTSRPLRDDIDNKNHYETLNVHPDASPAEIKKYAMPPPSASWIHSIAKARSGEYYEPDIANNRGAILSPRSFYALSKAHHPDHNRHDPHAPRRFMRISEAYSVLGHHEKRAKYDRDVLRRHDHGHHRTRAGASYHSTGPVGGRPPSGLSKRRGTFQGPPPSFFRSGGWGAQSAKRRAAHEDSTGGAEGAAAAAGAQQQQQHGGMGPGQDPFGHRDDVPHFDRQSHEKTGQNIDQRRAQRMAGVERGEEIGPEPSMTGNFFAILGVLAVAIAVPALLLGSWSSTKTRDKKDKKDKKAAA